MDDGEEDGTEYHECGSHTFLVIYTSEEGGEEYRAEGEHGWYEACEFGVYPIFEDHELCGKLEEGEYACVEHEAEEGDVPEALVGKEQGEVGESEALCAAS